MSEYIQEYERIVKNLIRRSFPALRDEKIRVIEKKVKYRGKADYFPWKLQITIDYRLRKFPKKSRKRILTHELCHMEQFVKDDWLKTNVIFILYLLSLKVRYKVEREANLLMIKKGHGKEVMTSMKGNIRRKIPASLTVKEVKFYMKKYKGEQK